MTTITSQTIAYNSETWTDGQSSTELIGPIRKDNPFIKFRCNLIRATDNTARLTAYYHLGKYLLTRPTKLPTNNISPYTIKAAKRCYTLFEEFGEDFISRNDSITIKTLGRCSKAKFEELRQQVFSSVLAGARVSEEDNLSSVF